MHLAYHRASSATAIIPQHTYPREPYAPFRVQYGHTSNKVANHGLICSAKMFPKVITPQVHSQLQTPMAPMSYHPFPFAAAPQYQ